MAGNKCFFSRYDLKNYFRKSKKSLSKILEVFSEYDCLRIPNLLVALSHKLFVFFYIDLLSSYCFTCRNSFVFAFFRVSTTNFYYAVVVEYWGVNFRSDFVFNKKQKLKGRHTKPFCPSPCIFLRNIDSVNISVRTVNNSTTRRRLYIC